MNKLLIVAPVVLTGAFLAIERPAAHRNETTARTHATALAEANAAALAKRQAAEAAAKENLRRTAVEREQQERSKAEAKERAYTAALRRIEDRTAAIVTTIAGLSTDLATLDRQLADLRTQEETVTRETFDLTKKLELQRTERRNAEFEIQRTTAMIARRMDESSATSPAR